MGWRRECWGRLRVGRLRRSRAQVCPSDVVGERRDCREGGMRVWWERYETDPLVADFVKQYTESAAAFARDCLDSSIGPAVAIRNLATGMAQDGYTDEFDHLRSFSSNLIEQSLLLALSNDQGVLDPVFAGDTMVLNYKCLNHRLGVVEELSVRPSKIGSRQVLVVHGTEDKAVRSLPSFAKLVLILYYSTHWREATTRTRSQQSERPTRNCTS